MAHLSHYTKGLILLGVINLFVVLLIFLSPDNNLFSNENAITGMAVSGFTDSTESTPTLREILINPKTGKVSSGGIFTVDVLANPALGSVNAKYYIVNLRFDGTKLTYNTNSVKSLKQGWTLTEKLTGTTTKTLIIEGAITGTGLSSGITNLFELGFTAETVAQDTNVPILILIAGFKESKTSTTISSAITKKTSSTITITAPVIIDNDGDGYSPPEDCDDDKIDDNDPMMQCPLSVLGCYEYIYQSGATDIIVVSQKHKYCAICKNPSIPLDYCDGIDNDCDGVVDGKTTMYENCPSGACAAASCPESPTETTSCAETEQKLGICIALLPTCNINECLNTLSVGGTSAGCDEKGTCTTVGENCVDKGSTIDFTIIGGKTISYPTQTCNTAGTHKLTYFCKSSTTGALTNIGVQKVYCLLGCKNNECVTTCSSASCPTCPTCPTISTTQPTVPTVFTPACGDSTCQAFENYLTCPQDCKKEDICNPAKPNGNANYCLIDTNSDGVYDNDLDKDGLSNEYELYLELNVPQEIKQDTQQKYKGWYDMNNPDTDGDGVLDNKDYCPGTDTQDSKLIVATGHINFNGCYVGDVGQQKKDILNPDGCFSQADTKFLISYYKSIVKGESCMNLYGQDIK